MARVLVLDENKYLRMLYALELAAEGYEVVLAASADEALERLKTMRPDIVVMDICRKDPEGAPDTAAILRRTYKLPVILNTTLEVSEGDWPASVVDARLVKSSDFSELKAKIRELLVRPSQFNEKEVLV